MLNTCYGRRAAEAWLVPEIIDACLFCGLKEQPETYQLEKLAQIIVVNFGYLSVDELLLFFFYFCSARYRHFYNTFDPSIIILSLRDFLCDRNRAFEERASMGAVLVPLLLVPTMVVERRRTTMINMVEVSVRQLRAPITVVELSQPITMLMEITSGQVTVLVTIGNREGTSKNNSYAIYQ
jgi:hypothetical protein